MTTGMTLAARWLTLPLLLSPAAALGQTIENAHVRYDFDPATYALTAVTDKDASPSFTLELLGNTPLWQMLMLDTAALAAPPVAWAVDFSDVWATDPNAAAVRSYHLEATVDEQILHLDWTNVPLPFGGDTTVNVEVHLPHDSRESVWTIDVATTGTTDALWRVTFPVLVLKPIGGDAGNDLAAVPIRSGLLVPNPHINKVAGFVPSDWPVRHGPSELAVDASDVFKSSLGGVHPGRWEMQWMHVYDGDTLDGLFMRSTDTDGFIKALTMVDVGASVGTLLHWQNYPENNTTAERAYTPPYDVRIQPMRGDWFDSAKLYRSWLIAQSWCAQGPLVSNPNFPHPETDVVGAGMTATPAVFSANVSAMIDACLEWETFLGAERGMCHMREWGSPVPVPNFLAFFTDGVAALNSIGWRTLPYTGSWLWNKNEGDDPQGTRAASVGINLNDEWNTEDRWTAYTMCPAASEWRSKYVTLTEALLAHGTTDQYCDLYPIARLCYATGHGHPVGGGNYWIDGYRAMVAEAKQHTRLLHPEASWMPEHRSEFGLDLFDYYWVQYWTYLEGVFKGFVSAGVPTPIMAAMVHDYIGCTSSVGADHATLQSSLVWRFVQAWSFVYGNTMSHGVRGSPTAVLAAPETRPDFLYLRELKHYRAAALDFLLYGEFLRPPDTGSGLQDLMIWGDEYAQPMVLGGAFAAADGRLGFAFSNYNHTPQTATYTLKQADYGFGGDTWELHEITPDASRFYGGLRADDYTRPWQFAPAGILMLEARPVSDTDGDGMSDGWEDIFGLDRNDPADALLDPDGDTLANRQEFANGTIPGVADSDGDGLRDDVEVALGSDPRPSLADLDRDGDVDIDDFQIVVGCLSGPGIQYLLNCEAVDIDTDGDVDLADFGGFQWRYGP